MELGNNIEAFPLQAMRDVYDRSWGPMSRNAPNPGHQSRLRTCLLVICLLLAPSSAAAQLVGAPAAHSVRGTRDVLDSRDTLAARVLTPLGQTVDQRDQRNRPPHAWPSNLAPNDSGPGVWKYVGWGALIGGALTGGYAAYRSRDCDDCMFTGFFIGGAAAIGAVLGGLVGSFVYADRYRADDR